MTMVLERKRHTSSFPCPVCGGYEELPHGKGVRCYGFSEGNWTHCTRPEYAGNLRMNTESGTYAHLMVGSCNCGKEHNPKPVKTNGKPRVINSRSWIYYNADRTINRRVTRLDLDNGGKSYPQERYENNQWIRGVSGIPNVLYRLPELLQADPLQPVLIPEGEKCVELLIKHGFIATTNPMGAEKWQPELNEPLQGRDVVLLPDNDAPGQRHVEKIAHSLQGIARSIRIIELPGLPDAGDVVDWFDAGGTKEQLQQLIDSTPYQKQPAVSDQQDESDNPTEKAFREMQDKHGVLLIGGNAYILHEYIEPERNRYRVDFLYKNAFTTYYSNKFIKIKDSNGNTKSVPLAKYWLDHPDRRTYKGLIFAPGMGADTGFYNLWRGFAVKPKEGDCSKYLDLLYDVICDGNRQYFEYLIGYMAECVQNFEQKEKPGVCIVLKGEKGTGKGCAIRNFGSLFGQHFTQVAHARYITGNFNSHLKDCIVLFADEAFWAGDKQGENTLKYLITEPDLQIEHKGKDPIPVKNLVRVFMASNSDWVVPATFDERRFFVLSVSNKHAQDHQYFKAIEEEMNNGGREALLYYLMNYELSGINLRKAPQTKALQEQKIISMDSISKFWYQCLQRGYITPDENGEHEWMEIIPTAQLYNEYIETAGKAGIPRRSYETEVGRKMLELCPEIKKRKVTVAYKDIGHSYSTKRQRWCYILPALNECRTQFEQIIGGNIDWNDDDELPF